jgi:hypothetical protein
MQDYHELQLTLSAYVVKKLINKMTGLHLVAYFIW